MGETLGATTAVSTEGDMIDFLHKLLVFLRQVCIMSKAGTQVWRSQSEV